MNKIGIVMGSDSDRHIAEKAVEILKEFNIPFEVHVFSAHRTPEEAHGFSIKAREAGFSAIIAIAGKAAHLAGVLAASTTLPVVGVPVKSSDLGGMDALLSTVQMPPGIPVATVAIDGGANAALLCVEMLAITDGDLAEKLADYRRKASEKVLEKNRQIEMEFNK